MVVTPEQGPVRDRVYSNYSRCRRLSVGDDSGEGRNVPKRNRRTPTCKFVRVRCCPFCGESRATDGTTGEAPRAGSRGATGDAGSIESRWETASRGASWTSVNQAAIVKVR